MGFVLFVLVVLSLYVRVWSKLNAAFFRGHSAGGALLLALLMLLFFLPVVLRRFALPDGPERILEQVSWIVLAWVFWTCAALLVFDLWNVAVWLLSYLPGRSDIMRLFAGDRLGACVALGAAALLSVWGAFEANAIRVNTVAIPTDKLPETLAEYRIAFISDLHIGPAISLRRLKKTMALLDATHADMLVSTGDFVDGHTRREEELARLFGTMQTARGNRFAVLGNHDCYSGIDFSANLHGEAGFTLLRNEGRLVDGWLWLYGEDDPASGRPMAAHMPEPPEGVFSLLLRHRPEWGGADLQLSGHSHGGQIFPFNIAVRLHHPFKEGCLHAMKEGGRFYVSMGTGVWGPPFRVMARPEITLFILHPHHSKESQ